MKNVGRAALNRSLCSSGIEEGIQFGVVGAETMFIDDKAAILITGGMTGRASVVPHRQKVITAINKQASRSEARAGPPSSDDCHSIKPGTIPGRTTHRQTTFISS